MRCVLLTLVAALAAAPAAANTLGCGGDAYTYAEVVEHAPGTRSRGPVIALPDSLCADLVEERRPAIGSLNLHIGDSYDSASGAAAASRLRRRPPLR